jgi:hypothetical protein
MEFERTKGADGSVSAIFKGSAEEYTLLLQVHSQPTMIDPMELLFRDSAWIVATPMDSVRHTLPASLPSADPFGSTHDAAYRMLQETDLTQRPTVLNRVAQQRAVAGAAERGYQTQLEAARQPTGMTAQLALAASQRRPFNYFDLILPLMVATTLGLIVAAWQYKQQHAAPTVKPSSATPQQPSGAKPNKTKNQFNPNWNPLPVTSPPKGAG